MKKMVIMLSIFALFVLDLLALDDITTGNEPSLFLEHTMLVSSFLLIPFLIILWRKNTLLGRF